MLNEDTARTLMRSFHEWREKAQNHAQESSRARILFVCVLLRWSGMRLGEALAFNDLEDIDEEGCRIIIRGKWARALPVSPSVARNLLEMRSSPALVYERGGICRMDQGYVRRIFIQRADETGLGQINPSSLRSFREAELLHEGADILAVKKFMGRNGQDNMLTGEEAELFRNLFLRQESRSGKGRHNVFTGVIQKIMKSDFSCLVVMQTESGLRLDMHCTLRTALRRNLAPGRNATVSVQSLKLSPARGAGECNAMTGVLVERIDGLEEVKLIVELEGGVQLTAITTRAMLDSARVKAVEGGEIRLFADPTDFIIEN